MRDARGLPWLSIHLTFKAELLNTPQKMDIQLVFPIESLHMPINKNTYQFRPFKPSANHIEYNGTVVNKSCEMLVFSFEVSNSMISYTLEDGTDECLPFAVTGDWKLIASPMEEKEIKEARKIIDSLGHITENEREDIIMENDMLVN